MFKARQNYTHSWKNSKYLYCLYFWQYSSWQNSLFGTVRLTKNVDIDQYQYSGYRIGFDKRSSFSFPNGGFSQNVILFGVDMSSSFHVDNKKKDILILGKGSIQGLEHTLTLEKMYLVNFTVTKKKFCLSLYYNWASNCLFVTNKQLFVNCTKIYRFKAKDSEIVATPLCLGNISKDWSVDNMKKVRLHGYVYNFSVDYNVTDVDDILDIYRHLMKSNNSI